MFDAESGNKEMKEKLLEKLIDHLMMMPDEEKMPDISEAMEAPEGELEGKKKPDMEVEIMSMEAKPKKKFTMPDGTEAEDESLEDILKRRGRA